VPELKHTAGSLAIQLQATLEGLGDLPCTGCSSLSEAQPGDITFMVNAKYAKEWKNSNASIGLIKHGVEVEGHDATTRALLRVDNPELAMARCLELFLLECTKPAIGIHPSACVDSTATIGDHVRIGPGVVVGPRTRIDNEVTLEANVIIGNDCEIGTQSELRSGVSVAHHCTVGSHCLLHANVSIGADGFGYCLDEKKSHLVKMEHIGSVVIGDHVDIGVSTCIDRGKFGSTKIGNGTKMDNLVQIGHNVQIGENCVLAAATGIGGSVCIGDWVQIGAQVGIAPHCKVGNEAKIGAKSGVMHDIPAGEQWLGVPACNMKDTLRQWVATRKMPKILAKFGKELDI